MTELKLEMRAEITDLLGRAAAAAPADPAIGWRYIRACLASADVPRAIRALTALTDRASDDFDAWQLLTDLRLKSGQGAESIGSARKAVDLRPRDSYALSALGFALRANGLDDEADDVFEKALATDPDNPHAARGVGQALIRRRAATDLLAHCQTVLPRLGARAWLVAQYAIALGLLGRREALASLLDYDRLLRERDMPVPDGFATLEAFNQALQREFDRLGPGDGGAVAMDVLHGGRRIKGGPHAAVAAFGVAGAPASAALIGAFDRERRQYEAWLSAAGDSLHLRMRPSRDRVRADAIITSRQAYLALHTHACTWVSAVYYAVVPPEIGARGKAGCMEFAPPLHKVELPDGIWPSRLVRPRPGLIAFFPAYMYHHVHASRIDGQRLVVTFDVLPQDYATLSAPGDEASLPGMDG